MAASGHRLARFARPVDNPAGQADGQAAPAHELAHRDCPPAPQPSPTYPPAPTARPSALLHQVLIFSGGKSLRPSACALRLPVGRQVEGGSRLAQRPRSGLALTRLKRPSLCEWGQSKGEARPPAPRASRRRVRGVQRGSAPLGKAEGRAVGGNRCAPPLGGHFMPEGEPRRRRGGTPQGCPAEMPKTSTKRMRAGRFSKGL